MCVNISLQKIMENYVEWLKGMIYQFNIVYIAYEIVHKFFKVRLKMKSYKTTSTRTLVVEAGKTE